MSEIPISKSILKIITAIVITLVILGLAMPIMAQQYYNTAPPFSIVSITTTPSPTIIGVSKVSITLIYTGGNYLYNTEFQLTTCSGTVVSQNPVFVGWLNPGQEVTVSYLINSTLPINCQATLTASWDAEYEQAPKAQVTTYIEVASSGSTTINFPLVIYGMPVITVTTNTEYLVSNLANPVDVTVINNGSGSVYDLQVSITPQGAAIAGGVSSINIGTLTPGSNYTITLYLIPTGTSSATLNIAYSGINQDGNSITGQYSLSLNVVVASSSQVLIFPVNSSLSIGMGKLTLGIRNTNPVPIYNVTLVITSSSGLNLMNTTTYDIGEIMPGSTDYLNIPVAVPLTSSSASIMYSLSYQYANGYPGSTQGSLSIPILNTPSILITGYQVAPTPITMGSTASVSLNFVNTGPVPAYNLNVTLIPGPGIKVVSQSSTYMGTLNSQQLSAVAFSFIAERPMNTSITFLIQYTDQFGQLHSMYYTVPIEVVRNATTFFTSSSVTSSSGFPSGSGQYYYYRYRYSFAYYLIMALAIVAIAIIIVIVLILRRRHGGSR